MRSTASTPDSGVTLILPAGAYAAWGWNNNYALTDFSEWRSEAEDAYEGAYYDDETFAAELADSLGSVPDSDAPWPLGYIDWERAARDLMLDYFEHAGFYFRNA